ncbi:MAG TPA: hypothetical protein VJS15_05650 [Allosphingosinicella sp.]|nr:hypothetical protein [Allosphingosinicella sp.]
MRSFLLLLLVALAAAAPAGAREIEPGAVRTARALGAERCVVILSLRSQMQLDGPLHVWFEAADEVARRSADHLRFERNQGVPIMGSNMIDRRAVAYAFPAGRWRLVASTVRCDSVPPPGATCTGGLGGIYPTGRYDGSSILLEVRPGTVLDAGELILEFPAGEDLTVSFRRLWRSAHAMRLKWRALPGEVTARLAAPFAGLPVARLDRVADGERSAISCADDRAKIHSRLALPFAC